MKTFEDTIKHIDTIIFDLDGTLLDGRWRHYQCYVDILKDNDFVPLDNDTYWSLKRQQTSLEILLTKSGAKQFLVAFKQQWLQRIELEKYLLLDVLHEKALDILRWLQQKNKRLMLVTLRNNPNHLDWQLDRLRIKPYFAKVISVDTAQQSKSALVKPLIQTSHVLWIGDTEIDVSSAKSLNIPIALVANGLRDEALLKKLHPDFLGKSLDQLFSPVMQT